MRTVREYLTGEILPHAQAEERTLYPAAARAHRLRRGPGRPARRHARTAGRRASVMEHVLRPVYEASSGVDGRVSIEVDPADRTRHRPHGRRGPRAVVAGRPGQRVHQDSGRLPGPAAMGPACRCGSGSARSAVPRLPEHRTSASPPSANWKD
jgi:hypothetical protein